MTEEETQAFSILRKDVIELNQQANLAPQIPVANHEVSPFEIREGIHKILDRKGDESNNIPYVNCNFVYGSSARVEWLWSLAKHTLTNHRGRMSPLLFECLLFLKVNSQFWDDELIIKALHQSKDANLAKRLQQVQLHNDLQMELKNMIKK